MLENIQLRIRIESEYNTSNATFAEAVGALTPKTDEEGGSGAQHVYIVGAYIKGYTETVGYGRQEREVERKTDEPVFGLGVTIYPPRKNYWSDREQGAPQYEPAQINWSALGSSSPDVARFYARLMETAANIADTVNAAL